MWVDIRNGKYSWLKLKTDKKKRLFRLVDIYSSFNNIVEDVKDLNKKVDEIKRLKDEPMDEE